MKLSKQEAENQAKLDGFFEEARKMAFPAKTDEFIWVLDASNGIVFKVEVPANFPEDAQTEDYEDYLEANLPESVRLKDCDWMIGEAGVITITRERYHLGF
jgi:hypothetical protein